MEIDEYRQRRVLVVDDSEGILRLVDRLLRIDGFDVVTVSNAYEAMNWCDSNGPPDLLLSDVCMSETDGPALYQLLNDKFPGLPALFMSAEDSEDLTEVLWPLLEKPFTRDELRSMINLSFFQAHLAKVSH